MSLFKDDNTPFGDLIPARLNTAEFLTAWREWVQDNKDRRLKMTNGRARRHLRALEKMTVEDAIRSIDRAIDHGWRTVEYGPGGQDGTGPSSVQPTDPSTLRRNN